MIPPFLGFARARTTLIWGSIVFAAGAMIAQAQAGPMFGAAAGARPQVTAPGELDPRVVARQSVAPQAGAPRPGAPQPAPTTGPGATLAGTVFSDPGEKPLANAEIVFSAPNRSVRSDSAGNFRVEGIPAGPQTFLVRHLGHEPYGGTMTFRAAQHVEADFVLRVVSVKLERVDVKANVNARYAMRLADFEARRRVGTGRFLTADVFAANAHREVDAILRSFVPGINIIESKGVRVLTTTRNGTVVPCKAQIILNGISVFNGHQFQLDFDINSIRAENVIGLEFYTVANTPLQFATTAGGRSGSVCGTAVIWTK